MGRDDEPVLFEETAPRSNTYRRISPAPPARNGIARSSPSLIRSNVSNNEPTRPRSDRDREAPRPPYRGAAPGLSRRNFLAAVGVTGVQPSACCLRHRRQRRNDRRFHARRPATARPSPGRTGRLYLDYFNGVQDLPVTQSGFEKESGYTVECGTSRTTSSSTGKVAPQLANGQNIDTTW